MATAEVVPRRRRRSRLGRARRQRARLLPARRDLLRDRAVPLLRRHRPFARSASSSCGAGSGPAGSGVVDLQPVPGERIAIPYEGTTLKGYFFRAPDAEPGERRPLVVMNNGSDGATSAMWLEGGAAAAERGYHWMTFDGPGQQAALYEQNIPFRHDWEAVLTPVLDAILARPDVDEDRVALIGVSQAGYWVPRAIAFEHRFAAAVADGGVVDVSRRMDQAAARDDAPAAQRRRPRRVRSRDAGRREQVARRARRRSTSAPSPTASTEARASTCTRRSPLTGSATR